MKKGMNRYVAGLMLAIIVTAIIIIVYAIAKKSYEGAGSSMINLGRILGV